MVGFVKLCFAAVGIASVAAWPFAATTSEKRAIAPRSETLTTSGTGTYGGYYYSLYIEANSGATFDLGTGTYTLSWTSASEDVVAGIGWSTGSTSRVITYTASYDADDDSLIALYGWSTDPLVEYYVIDYVGSYNPGSAGTLLGQVTSDGGTYNIYETTRTNAPSIEGTSTFHQYLSVRTSNRLGGTITFANHVAAWASHGLVLGSMNYQIMATEGYESSGETTITLGSTTGTGGSSPPSTTSPSSISPPKTSTKASTPVTSPTSTGGSIAEYGQCGGIGWTGSGTCVSGTQCVVLNSYYSQCRA